MKLAISPLEVGRRRRMDPSCGEEFWSRTAYDVATLCITVNETKQADRSSRMDRIEKPEGSVTLYVGPDKPEGDKAKNWAQTCTARRGSPL